MNIPSHKLLAIIDAQVQLVGLGNDLSAVMDAASAKAVALTGADGAVVELLEDDAIVYRSASGIAEAQLGLRMPVANSLSGRVLTSRAAALCTDSESDERVNREACRKVGLRAMVIVPLIAGNEAIAVMKLVWKEPREFNDSEEQIAQLLANMTAMLMQRATQEGPNVLKQRMTLDEASGTANRSFFYEQLQARLAAAQGNNGHLGVGVVRVNGIEMLPEALADISRRIERECRAGDLVARIGHDEFGVILNMASRRSIVTSQLHRISLSVTGESLPGISDAALRAACHTGSSIYPEDARTAIELVQAARP
ncbi:MULTISPECIES: GAF domain-containing protein [unclassified Duganella]|uniref:sensor domain-containing diguanylate cyclase n=1 Tax=unclassified Duganella TaxID=2636909 RepID=UPI0008817D1E|nr:MULTISPECIES: GAF domain-containing protein [unclassified Duganella]SDH45958.1 GGDEF domain-containing protein, diguanylate cyclase (c-di-GMP synthetase) or its enzymatically inactive variants [Duganella sp. OV458]SDK56616.1 diguanylate cyclase with GAF sensor [Duganella sp. OV510]